MLRLLSQGITSTLSGQSINTYADLHGSFDELDVLSVGLGLVGICLFDQKSLQSC